MKKTLFALTLLSTFTLAACSDMGDMHHSTQASQKMMNDTMGAMHSMNTVKLTGVTDVDFVTAMIPHHEGAIVMSESILPKLTDPQVRQLAENIIVAQKKEVAFMKSWLANNKTFTPVNMAASQKMMTDSMKVMHGMQEVKLTGNPNIDFIAGMIPHHQAAVKMAEVVLPYLHDKQIIAFDKNVIADQTKEIQWMQNWLATHNK